MPNVRRVLGGWIVIVLLAESALCVDGPASPQPKQQPVRFVRLTRDEDNSPVALETPIVRCASGDSLARAPVVDLVAALHVGEKSYYQQLNSEFQNYDAVLYELVAPESSQAPRAGDEGDKHLLSLVQNGMKDLLALEFQLKWIDYTRSNMVHADMSPDQFAESMRSRGESFMTILGRMIGYGIMRQAESDDEASDGRLFLALFDKNRALALKRVLAAQFDASEASLAALEGPTGSTLISGRNAVAMAVLREQIAAGKRKIAIFYGAAHMPNFQTRLRDDLGLIPVSTRWLVAWKLTP
jgi:hypothetical protein